MTIKSPLLRSAAVLSTVLAASFAQAQDKDSDAERLFNEAKTLMEAHKFAEACPKLESAYRKDQQQGTLLNLAYCHKEMGAPWIAWTEFREAESRTTDQKRKDFARDKMKEIEKGLSKVVVDPQTKYELTEVVLEDRRIYDAEKGTPFFAEPGQRKAIFHAKGKKAAILLISVGSPKEKMLHVQVPEMVDEEPIAPTPPENTEPPPPPPPPPPAEKTSSWSGQKTFAVILGVAGVGGVAVGSIFGIKTLGGPCADGSKAMGGELCTPHDRNSASSDAMISTIGFVAGGALLAGAVVVWITAPSGQKSSGALATPAISAKIGPSWAGLSGTF